MVVPVPGPRDDAFERAVRDPLFLEAVRAAHRGSWAVLDALWWASHPDDTAPSGTAAPQARVRDLQRRVFAADADAVGDPAVIGALRELESEIARERMAIDAAVVAVRFDESRRVGAPLLVQAPAAPPVVQAPAAFPVPVAPGPLAPGRPARVRLAAYLAAAVLVGLVIGGQLAATPARDAVLPPTSSTAADDIDEAPVLALAIFDRARIVTDIPPTPVPSSFDRSSLRAVWSVSWDIAGPRAEPPYFVARGAGGRVCLLAMVTDARHASTCVSTAEFAETGMRLFWTTDVAVDATATPHTQNLVLEWTPAGRFEVESADPPRRTWRRGLCPTDLPRPC
ncbi:hypothetical protein [Cryobacterium sp.]|jgi:hypothetical protein|uniref:hypothetical protein n=1 Tax=Cryobacterium sp. TaxID=1926290 RepID=UPI0026216EB1|nr:hypothetical protein [Cryobacterium sp.]MCU1446170.1 hypothetical protein [Cryobacterium sp.]